MNKECKIISKCSADYRNKAIDFSGKNLNIYALANEIVKKLSDSDSSYMIYENNNEISIGIEKYLEINIFPKKILLANKGKKEELIVSDLSKDMYELFKNIPMDKWRAYGIANFDYAKNTFLESVGKDKKLLKLFIPKIDIRITSEKIQIYSMERIADICADIETCIKNCLKTKGIKDKKPRTDLDIIKSTDSDYYKEIVSNAVKEICDDKYEKVILSRKINLKKRISFMDSYLEGRKFNNPARSYCMKIDNLEVVGFSPETVVEVDKEKTVSTFPLAGTRALTKDKEINKKLKEELLKDPKEIAEHAVSVKLAYEELEKVCDEESVSIIQFMDVLERGTVQHLASRLQGRIKNELNEWHAFTALFPAVTASGIPKKECIEAIDRLEKDERGLYSGGVLTYDKDGTLDVALVLRTAFQNDNEAWVRVGAGIVKLSNSERELEETKEKVGSIINRLVYIKD